MPHFYALTRLRLRSTMRQKGYAPADVRDYVEAATDDVIDTACAKCAVKPLTEAGAVGGTFIDSIIAFFESDAGKAVIAALLALLAAVFV